MRRTPRLVAPTLLAALVLTGCLPSSPAPTPPATTDAEPVFASEDEALAAAEEAYALFQATADQIIRDGGASPERIEDMVSPDLYAREVAGYEQLRTNGWRGIGQTTFTLRLQAFSDDSVVAYACDDLTQTDVLDSAGQSVVRPGRETLLAYEVEFDPSDDMRILRKDIWEGGGVC